MTYKYLKDILYLESTTVQKVVENFNVTAGKTENRGFGIIVNNEGQCVGVVSDGDIRRKLVDGLDINAPIKKIMNTNFKYVSENDTYHHMLRQFDKNIVNLPVLDKRGRPKDLHRYSKFVVSARTEQKIIRARVPVRVSYSGGGTDLSDFINTMPAAVLSSTINKYCTASVIIRDDDEIHIKSKDLGLEYVAKNIKELKFGDNLDLIKAAVKIMEPDFGFNLETFAEFEPGTGLGGSSAVVVSVLGALNYFRNEQQLDIYQISDLAYQVERIDMKIQGGWQDQYATAFGGFSWIEFRENEVIVNPISLHRNTLLELEYNLMLFRLKGNRSSSKIQKRYKNSIQNDVKNNKLFAEMIDLAKDMKEALLKAEIKTFADLLHESWLLKKSMNNNVTNEFIEDCYSVARNQGALGGKLLGAGKSGYLLLYVSPLHQNKIKKELSKKNVFQERFKFSQNGLEVWSTKR